MPSHPSNGTVDEETAPRTLSRRFEAEFLRPYRQAILLGLLGLIVQSVLLLPIPILQGWVVDRLVEYFQVEGSGISPAHPTPFGPGADQAPRRTSQTSRTRDQVVQSILFALIATMALHSGAQSWHGKSLR